MMQYNNITPTHIRSVYEDLYVGDKVLSKKSCDNLIADFSPRCIKSRTIDNSEDYRHSLSTVADKNHFIIKEIKQYCSQITKTNIAFQEQVQFLQYKPGMYYKEHYDFFENNKSIIPAINGAQRLYSFIFYLNDGSEGGETRFPKFKISFKPETGKMLMWKNLKNKNLNYDMLHESKPTKDWTKYAIVLWIRI